MILSTKTNLPVTAASFDNSATVLNKLRFFLSDNNFSYDDFYLFVTTPSSDRDKFLKTLNHAPILNEKYIENKYE